MNKIIEERIGSLIEEVEIANNARLSLTDLKDEMVSLQWVTRIIKWALDRAIDIQRQLPGVKEMHSELEDTKKFEDMVHDKIQELQTELKDSDIPREKEILVNEIETLECVLGHLDNLKANVDNDDDKTQAIEIAAEI
ncbi:MAG: hypothetical protein WBX01_09805 [Nitrososphaeraceae archaeon]